MKSMVEPRDRRLRRQRVSPQDLLNAGSCLRAAHDYLRCIRQEIEVPFEQLLCSPQTSMKRFD